MLIETPFELTTPRGWPLRGDVRRFGSGGSTSVVVICHGFKGFKDWGFFPEIARRLAAAGHTAVSFNFSGNGVGAGLQEFSEAERFRQNTLSLEIADLCQVLDALGAGTLPGMAGDVGDGCCLLAHSRGSVSALVAATRRDDVRRLVTWNGIGNLAVRYPAEMRDEWRRAGKLDVVNARTGQVLEMGLDALDDLEAHLIDYDPLRLAPKLKRPWLIIHGTRDLTVPVQEGEALAREGVPGMARFHPIEGGDHTLGVIHPYQRTTPQLDAAVEATLEFLAEDASRGSSTQS